jgi:SAM-dependent methyltransferase
MADIDTSHDPPYRCLADVYDLLVPPVLRTPEGSVEALAPWVDALAPGARVLDCACGTGTLAVGLALRGFAVDASDLSPAMIARTRRLAAERGATLRAEVRAWEDLEPGARYAAVFCVGNSLTHARDRVRALRAMAATLRGVLVLTSRNWERERAAGSRTEVEGPVTRVWTIPERWEDPHFLDITAGGVHERLTAWAFTHEQLHEDVRAAGLSVTESTYARDADRYLVAATRAP